MAETTSQPQSWLLTNIKPVLALMIVVLGFGYFYMCSIRNIKPDPQILIAMVTSVSLAIGYYFGSSQGSSAKNDTIAANAGNPSITNADTVNVAAQPENPINKDE